MRFEMAHTASPHVRRLVCAGVASAALALLAAVPVLAAPPLNDDFDTATVLTTLPFTTALDTVAATTASDDPGSCRINNSVWYRYTPSRAVTVDINTAGSSYDAIVGVFTGPRSNLQQVACERRALLDLEPGVTYHLMVTSCCYFGGPGGGDLKLSIQEPSVPPNDEWETATEVTGVPFQLTQSTLLATTGTGDDFFYDKKSVWFSFTPTLSGRRAISTTGSDYQTDMAVYTGTADARAIFVCEYPTSGVQSCDLTAGTTYYIVVSAAYGFGGTLVFSVVDPPTIALTIDGRASMANGPPAAIHISGTVRCNQLMTLQLEGWFLQANASSFVRGQIVCLPPGVAWALDVPDYGYFGPGDGSVSISASGASVGGGAYANLGADVLLAPADRVDFVAPELHVPGDFAVEATSPAGAVVVYTVTATDAVDPSPTTTCQPASGSVLRIGDTSVSCIATDAAGNAAMAHFVVHVRGPADLLAGLATSVAGVGRGASLLVKIKQAQARVAVGELKGACAMLGAFLEEVQAQTGRSIPPVTALSLTANARQIRNVLGC